jgi:aspartate racemase
VIIDSNPKTPDRTASILSGDEKIIAHLKASAKALEGAGAEAIVIACNTSHAYLDEIREALSIPVLDMIAAAVDMIKPDDTPVGLLATDGTMKKELYQNCGGSKNMEWIILDDDRQKKLMDLIYSVKSGGDLRRHAPVLKDLLAHLKGRGARSAVLGCSELSLFAPIIDGGIKLIDPCEAIAREAIKFSAEEY